ncbi:MAG: RidA family protein [Streptomyces sp.]|uniref:RidA family protein n=1 Tax=Streptomyces sp. TaxID=1931 RepID=UPI003D6A3ABE
MSDSKTAITPATHTAPPAKFSHGVKKGNILQVAGQVGFGPAVPGQAPAPVGPGLREQTLQTLANVESVLREGGASWEDAVMGFLRGYSALQGGEEADSCGAGQGAALRRQGGARCSDPQI